MMCYQHRQLWLLTRTVSCCRISSSSFYQFHKEVLAMRRKNTRRAIVFVVVMATAVMMTLPVREAGAQPPNHQQSAFTVDDLLNTANVGVADLSDDGRWVAATVSKLNDRLGIDNHRFGDPTYVPPGIAEVWIIDTQSAKAVRLFTDKRQVRGLKWSSDGNRLALFVLKGDVFEPVIWERTTGKFVTIELPGGKQADDDAGMEWSSDGQQLMVALRADEWRKKTAERFRYETAAPVVAHSSKEPFLPRADLRRMRAI